MKTIKLQKTGIEFEVPDSIHYNDDGVVSSAIQHTEKLRKRYQVSKKYREHPYMKMFDEMGISKGRTYIHWTDERMPLNDAITRGYPIHIHTFVNRGSTQMNTTFTKGHEETHVLDILKKRGLLNEAYRLKGFLPTDLEMMPSEIFCDFGGIYALLENYENIATINLPISSEVLKWGKWFFDNKSHQSSRSSF